MRLLFILHRGCSAFSKHQLGHRAHPVRHTEARRGPEKGPHTPPFLGDFPWMSMQIATTAGHHRGVGSPPASQTLGHHCPGGAAGLLDRQAGGSGQVLTSSPWFSQDFPGLKAASPEVGDLGHSAPRRGDAGHSNAGRRRCWQALPLPRPGSWGLPSLLLSLASLPSPTLSQVTLFFHEDPPSPPLPIPVSRAPFPLMPKCPEPSIPALRWRSLTAGSAAGV